MLSIYELTFCVGPYQNKLDGQRKFFAELGGDFSVSKPEFPVALELMELTLTTVTVLCKNDQTPNNAKVPQKPHVTMLRIAYSGLES